MAEKVSHEEQQEGIRVMEQQLELIDKAMKKPPSGEDQKRTVHEMLLQCVEYRRKMEDICVMVMAEDGDEATFNRITGELDRLERLQGNYQVWCSSNGAGSASAPPIMSFGSATGAMTPAGSLAGRSIGGSFLNTTPGDDVAPGGFPRSASPVASQTGASSEGCASRQGKKIKKKKKEKQVAPVDELGFQSGDGYAGGSVQAPLEIPGSFRPQPAGGSGIATGLGMASTADAWGSASAAGMVASGSAPWSQPSAASGSGARASLPVSSTRGGDAFGASFHEESMGNASAGCGGRRAVPGAADNGWSQSQARISPANVGPRQSGHSPQVATLHIQCPYAEIEHDVDAFTLQFQHAVAKAVGVAPHRIRVRQVRPGRER